MYFPNVFGDKQSTLIEDVKIRALKIADEIINKNDNQEDIDFYENNIIKKSLHIAKSAFVRGSSTYNVI